MRKLSLALGALLCLCAMTLPFAVLAQQPPKVYRIGILLPTSQTTVRAGFIGTFRNELRDLGYIEGQNLVMVIDRSDDELEQAFNSLGKEGAGGSHCARRRATVSTASKNRRACGEVPNTNPVPDQTLR